MNAIPHVRRLAGKTFAALVWFAALAVLPDSIATAQVVDVYLVESIYTAAGEPIQNAVMVVTEGKITALGSRDEMKVPEGANVHDLGNKIIIPGLVIAQSDFADESSNVNRALTPYVSAVDGFDFFADRSNAFKGGVTTVQLSPGGGRLISGTGAVVKLTVGEKSARLLADDESLRVVLTSASRTPPTIYEPPVGPVSEERPIVPTRPQLARSLAAAASGLRAVFRVAKERMSEVQESEADRVMDALVAHLVDGGLVRFDANTAAEVRLAMQVAKQNNLTSVLVNPRELDEFFDDDDAPRIQLRGVILRGQSPGEFSNPSAEDAQQQVGPWESARELVDAGFPLAVYPANDNDMSDMLFVAGQFMQGDLTRAEALCAVTCWPAQLMGVDDQVGTLAVGRAADFVVLTDEPFSVRSTVWATYVDGEAAYEREPSPRTTAIRAGGVYAGNGQFLHDASVVVKGKTLRSVGESVSLPLDATVREYPNAVIVPGFIDLGASVGTAGASLGNNLNLQSNLAERIDPADPAIAVARESGVTTVLLGGGGNNPSPLVAFKLGDDARVVGNPVAVRFPLTGNLSSRVPAAERALAQGKAYHERWKNYEQVLAEYEAQQRTSTEDEETSDQSDGGKDGTTEESRQKTEDRRKGRGSQGNIAMTNSQDMQEQLQGRGRRGGTQDDAGDEQRQTEQNQETKDEKQRTKDSADAEDQPPKKPEVDEALEPYRALFSGQIPAFVEARTLPEIEAALKLFRTENDIRTILVGVDDLKRFPELLDGQDVNVCAGPALIAEGEDGRLNIPQMLANDQIAFGFRSEATTGVRDLPQAVQFAVYQGLGTEDALRGLTYGAAELLSSEANFGSLEAGKDADLVVLSGPPFELSTKVLAVMIDGQWVYEKENGR